MTKTDIIATIADRIAHFEGFYLTQKQSKVTGARFPTLAQKNNNPGNLRSWGDMKIIGGYAVFDTPESGFKALKKQVEKNIDKGLTFYEFFAGKPNVYPGYAPAADKNHPKQYSEFVAKGFTGATIDVVIKSLISE